MTTEPCGYPPFRYVIARACADALRWDGDIDEELIEAEAILATPEMQAVRQFIVRIHAELLDGGEAPTTTLRSLYGLPDSVIEWALA